MFFILLLSLLQVQSQRKFCGHDEVKEKHQRSRFLADTNRYTDWKSIRFAVDWSNMSSASKAKYEIYVDASIEYYKNALKVHRLIDSTTWDSSMSDLTCDYKSDDFYGETISADYFLIIAETYDSEGSYVAAATGCAYDYYTAQPVYGYVVLNTAYTDDSTSRDMISTITHEIAHALGFSVYDFPNYLNPDGDSYGETYYQDGTARGDSVRYITTPNVVERARIAFDCDTLIGLELETQGGGGSAYSHWNARIMKTEFMSPQADTADFIYSDLTLALFEDSGWYKPDYAYGQNINFGYKKGCDFHSKKCIINEEPVFEEFCVDTAAESLCHVDHVSKGQCWISYYYDEIPNKYDYFGDDYYGGNEFADFCPIVYSLNNCRLPDCPNEDYGEKYCDECRCVEGYYSLTKATANIKATCHYIECDGDSVIITVGDQKVICTESGVLVDVPIYEGKLKCPNIDVICGPPACMNNCYGEKCVDGVCSDSTLNEVNDYNTCDGSTDDGSDDGSDNGTDDGADDGTDDGADDGTDDGADDGTDDGADDGTDDGADDGTDDGADDGTDDGADDGTDGGTDNGTDNGTDENDGNSGVENGSMKYILSAAVILIFS